MKYVRCTERLADEAITMIERLTAENAALREKVPQWISVEDRLPEALEAHNGKENSWRYVEELP